MWSCFTFPMSSFLRPSVRPPFLPDSQCVTLCSFCVSLWKLGTPNYRGLSIIMYLAAEMYWCTVPPWKKKTPNINWGILLLRSISMFLTVIFIPSDLNKYLCLVKKEEEEEENNIREKKSIWKLVLCTSGYEFLFKTYFKIHANAKCIIFFLFSINLRIKVYFFQFLIKFSFYLLSF